MIANALIGVHRALIDYSRKRILDGAPNDRIVRELRAQGKRALGALEDGLASVGAS